MCCFGQKKIGISSLVCLLVMMAGSLHAATAEEALKGCKGFPDVERPNTCRSYFLTILDYIRSDDPAVNPKGALCVEDDVPLDEIIHIIVSWIEDHPSSKGVSLFDAAHNALEQKFECD